MSEYKWERWFARYPVEVEAYNVDEIVRGKFRYKVWLRWVERAWKELEPENYENAQDEIPAHWVYRIRKK